MGQPRGPLGTFQCTRVPIVRKIPGVIGCAGSKSRRLRSDTDSIADNIAMDAITLAALAEFPRRLEAYYGIVPSERKNWTPSSWDGVPSEPFTPVEQICHVKDIEIDGYHVRLRRTLEERHPLLASIDGERLAQERAYGSANAAHVLRDFARARGETLALISRLTPQQLSRTAEF